jgi:hypothetical protein
MRRCTPISTGSSKRWRRSSPGRRAPRGSSVPTSSAFTVFPKEIWRFSTCARALLVRPSCRTEGGPARYRGVRLFLLVILCVARLAASRCSLAQGGPDGQDRVCVLYEDTVTGGAIRGRNGGNP